MKLPFNYTNVPSGQNAFGALRKYDIHTGVDLFCEVGQAIQAIEDGVVVNVLQFTGGSESPWWYDTYAVMIEGKSGVILYGEIETDLKIGDTVKQKDVVGKVLQVLKNDKGKPMAMLHLELYKTGTRDCVWWKIGQDQPNELLDSTILLASSISSSISSISSTT